MFWNILAEAVDKKRAVPVGEATLYALLGFLTVFVGIALLIFIVWLVGKIMTKLSASNGKTKEIKPVGSVETPIVSAGEEEISEETIAAITAVIMAYYQEEQPKCEFRVKRIKKV